MAQWTKRLTRNGQTRVRIRKEHIFDITLTRTQREAKRYRYRAITSEVKTSQKEKVEQMMGYSTMIMSAIDTIKTHINKTITCTVQVYSNIRESSCV